MTVEKITLTARFKVDLADVEEAAISEIYHLFEEYEEIVNELIELATSNHITSFVELYHAKYRELRQRYSTLPITLYLLCLPACHQHLQILHRIEEAGDVREGEAGI